MLDVEARLGFHKLCSPHHRDKLRMITVPVALHHLLNQSRKSIEFTDLIASSKGGLSLL